MTSSFHCFFVYFFAVASLMAGCTSPPTAPSPPSVSVASAAPMPAPKSTAQKFSYASTVSFVAASALLTPAAMAQLADLASRTHDVDLDVIIAVGHADSREAASETAAMALSNARAQAVKAYLSRLGVNPSRLYTEGKGRGQPIADNTNATNRSKNRRVDVEVIGTRNKPQMEDEIAPKGHVSVLFGTNRARTGETEPGQYFGSQETEASDKGRLTLGRVTVRVPPVRLAGELKEPGMFWVMLEKITTGPVADSLAIPKISAVNLNTDFSFVGPLVELDEQAFAATLKTSIARSKTKSALVYIHGFANSFQDAAFRTAQFAYDLADERYDVVPVLFSWPSDPDKFNYVAAADRTWSAGNDLAIFLEKLSNTTGAGVIHIVAHSKGAQVLGFALETLRTPNLFVMSKDSASLVPRFRQIILAAPDIRASDFKSIILPAVASHHSVTNYVSSNDLALRASKRVNAGARAGDSGPGAVVAKGVDTIDVTKVNYEPDGHSSFAESPRVIADIRQQLQGIAPARRKLLHPPNREAGYWLLED